GVCVGCLNDQDCDTGQLCGQLNTCETIVSPPECETNDDCVEHVNGAFCLPDAGVCVGCVTDQDCDLGEFCSELNVCETVVTPTSCESNDDCVQQEGSPVCRLDTGACVECLLDDDCWRGICRDNNTCGPPPECYVDGDCAE